MKRKRQIFEKVHSILGGYTIAVRDSWGFKITRKHISEEQKEKFVNKFGETIITEDEFYKWWEKIMQEENQ